MSSRRSLLVAAVLAGAALLWACGRTSRAPAATASTTPTFLLNGKWTVPDLQEFAGQPVSAVKHQFTSRGYVVVEHGHGAAVPANRVQNRIDVIADQCGNVAKIWQG